MRAINIDILRITLCLLVIQGHYLYRFCAGGGIAVIGFFVISGFFLEKLFICSTEEVNFTQFYKKKIRVLFPEYITAALLGGVPFYLGLTSLDVSKFEGSDFVISELLFELNGPGWYMNNLFLFFALAPVFYCLHKTKWGIHITFVSALAYAVLLLCCYGEGWLYYSAQTNSVYFVAGMLACRIANNWSSPPKAIKLMATFAAIYLLARVILSDQYFSSAVTPLPPTISLILSCLSFMLIVPALDTPRPISAKSHQAIIWLSSLTYSIYLFHIPAKQLVISILKILNLPNLEAPSGIVAHLSSAGLFLAFTFIISIAFTTVKKRVTAH